MKRITIKDVAREAGVSFSAVSRSFTEGASVSAITKAKVLEAADRLGYRPSTIARGLVQQRTNTVMLISGRMLDQFDTLFLEELSHRFASNGRRLIFAPAPREDSLSDPFLQAIDQQVDAVIVAAGTMSLETSERCVSAGVPVILAGRVLERPGIDCVVADNLDGGRQAAELLLRIGRKRLAFFAQARATFSDRERLAGFQSVARQASVFRADDMDDGALFDSAVAELSSIDRPDAIFCSTDRLAIALIEAARALGLSTPGDVAVVGFNNIPAARRRSFRLTTLDYPVSKVVDAVTELVAHRIETPNAPAQLRRVPVRLVLRDTSALEKS